MAELNAGTLRQLADMLDKQDEQTTLAELRAQFDELAGRKPTREELIEALAELNDDELQRLGLPARERAAVEQERDEERPALEVVPEPEPEPEPKRVRPGRKSGHAYSWTVDDDGNVQQLDGLVRVYSGADEPDEVELPDEPEPEQEPDDGEAEPEAETG